MGECGEAFGLHNVTGMQGHPSERGEGKVPFPRYGGSQVPIEEAAKLAIAGPDRVIGSGVVVTDDQSGPPHCAFPPTRILRWLKARNSQVVVPEPAGHLHQSLI